MGNIICKPEKRLNMFDGDVWDTFFDPGEVTEVRLLKASGIIPVTKDKAWRTTISGYFDNHQDFCRFIKPALECLAYEGAYFTLNVVDPRLLARACNRLKISDLTTGDHNIIAIRRLPLDFDPVRPAGISSSNQELQDAMQLRETVAEWVMDNFKFDAPIRGMSGNGGHLLFRLPDLLVTPENVNYVATIIKGLADKFDTDTVKIDRSVSNPSRIWKLYGSTARKGDDLPAGPGREARPHRIAFIDNLGGELSHDKCRYH